MGLYCKISIVPFFLVLKLLYFIVKRETKRKFKLISFKRYFRYIKIIFNKKVLKTIIVFSIISNSIVLYQSSRYENLYKGADGEVIKITGIVLGKANDNYILKVLNKKYKNSKVYLSNVRKSLEYGDKIEITGKFIEPSRRTNYKGFDYKNYLKTLGIYGSISAKDVKIISKDNTNLLFRFANKLSKKLNDIIENLNLKNEQKELLRGILLGNKENMPEEILNNFSASNISYILAVSGMHISYIIIFSSFIFNILIGKHNSKPVTCIFIIIYMFITNFTPSVVRAGIVGILVIQSNFFYRKSDIANNLSLALLIILVYNPFSIQNVGLKLSYAGTIGIIVFMPTLNKIYKSFIKKIEKRAIRKNNIITKKILKITENKFTEQIIQAIFVTISASFMVIPIIALSFNKLSITSLFISVIAGFLVGPIVIIGLVALIVRVSFICKILEIFLILLISFAKIGSGLPLNQINVVTPSILEVLIYYFFIFLINFAIKINLEKNKTQTQKRLINLYNLLKYYTRQNKKKLIAVILVISMFSSFIIVTPKKLKIFFIDVNQGDSSLIVTPKGKKILIDGGGSENSNFDIRRKSSYAIYTW